MLGKITVSVIIPVFNRPKSVHQAIESVLNQDYKNWELIVVDDGSTDGTLESLSLYQNDHRIRILSLQRNGHPGYVRNRGVEEARGEWLAFLDSDDIWYQNKLSEQLSHLEKNENSLIIHSREHWVRNGKTVSQVHRKHTASGDLFDVSLGKCEIGPSTVVIRRSFFEELGGFREDLEICEDYEMWLRVTDRSSIEYINEALVEKRAGAEDQLSAKYGYIEIFKIKALKDLVDQRSFSEVNDKAARKELSKKCRIYSKGCRKRGRIEEADKYMSLHFFYRDDDIHNKR